MQLSSSPAEAGRIHEGAYVLTTVPTVAMIKQMLSGKV
jgi:hypothetical protein